MTEQRKCMECGEPIIGRADKKFCDDNCRNNYYNKHNSDVTAQVRNVNNILRKNRRIMETLLPAEGTFKISKAKLLHHGFNFTYHTHTYTSKKGNNYVLCYDYGYMPLDNDYFMIVRWEKE